jgi:hypothetical protein
MNAPLNFDATKIDPTDTFSPLPAGDYQVVISKAEVKPTKNQQGRLLELTLKVVDGQARGRVIFERLNLWNQNQTAVEIAQKRLSQYCHAAGRLRIADASELMNIPVLVTLSIRQDPSGQYGPSNEVRSVKAVAGGSASASAPAPAPAAGSTPPWA